MHLLVILDLAFSELDTAISHKIWLRIKTICIHGFNIKVITEFLIFYQKLILLDAPLVGTENFDVFLKIDNIGEKQSKWSKSVKFWLVSFSASFIELLV